MTGIYTFANTPEGRTSLIRTAVDKLCSGFTIRRFEETIAGYTLLKLEVTGKRIGEGEIAADMKARKEKD